MTTRLSEEKTIRESNHPGNDCKPLPDLHLAVSRQWAPNILGYDLDLSESRDVIGQATIWFKRGHFL